MKQKTITTLDNGGLPFAISLFEGEGEDAKIATLFKRSHGFHYEKMFDGTNGNSNGFADAASLFLLETGKEEYKGRYAYRYIGEQVYDFTTDEEIIEFVSPIGNSAVPYPVAFSENYCYFMLDQVKVPKTEFTEQQRLAIDYDDFYAAGNNLKKIPFSDIMKVVGRHLHLESELRPGNEYEYFIQKQSIAPTELMENKYDEDDSDSVEILNSMGALGWELCGVIPCPGDENNAKFVYKRPGMAQTAE